MRYKWYQGFQGSTEIMCRSQEHLVFSTEIMCQSHSNVRLFVRSCVDLRTSLVLLVGIGLGGDCSKTHLGFRFEVNV